jgi:hypothetical protein
MRQILDAIAKLAKGSVCEVLQSKICEEAGLKERAARNALNLLEEFKMIDRSRRSDWAKLGRPADTIRLSVERNFHLTKETIMASRSSGPTGTHAWDQPAADAGAPKHQNADPLYKARARSVLVETSTKSISISTRVRFDAQRDKWRAALTVSDVTMELGRFDTEDEAVAYAAQSETDVRRNITMKAGTPSFPIVDPSKANIDAPELGAWLFGDDVATDDDPGAGEASALGQGTKFLAGLGGAHEKPEYDAARA